MFLPYLSLSKNGRKRQDLSKVFFDHCNESEDNKITILDSFTENRNPLPDEEVSNEIHDIKFERNTILSFIQRLQHYLKVSVGTSVSKFTE